MFEGLDLEFYGFVSCFLDWKLPFKGLQEYPPPPIWDRPSFIPGGSTMVDIDSYVDIKQISTLCSQDVLTARQFGKDASHWGVKSCVK